MTSDCETFFEAFEKLNQIEQQFDELFKEIDISEINAHNNSN